MPAFQLRDPTPYPTHARPPTHTAATSPRAHVAQHALLVQVQGLEGGQVHQHVAHVFWLQLQPVVEREVQLLESFAVDESGRQLHGKGQGLVG